MLKQNEPSEQRFIYTLMLPMIVIFLMVAPFMIALFNGSYVAPHGLDLSFERAIYTSLIWGAVLLALLCIYYIFVKKFRFQEDAIALFVFVFPFGYAISYFNAASQHFAEKELLVSLLYAALFAVAYLTIKQEQGNRMIQLGLTISGYLVILYGFFNLFGHVYFDQSVMLTDQGLRMTGVFQYANTYALFTMIFMFFSVHYVMHSNKRWHVFLHALMLVPIIVSLLLTLSRGGWLVVPFVLMMLLPFYKLARQLAVILYVAIGAVGAFLISSQLDTIGNTAVRGVLESLQNGNPQFVSLWERDALIGWGWLLLSSIIVAGIIFALQVYVLPLLERFLAKLSSVRLSNLILPIIGLVIGVVAVFALFTENSSIVKVLPANLQERVANITLEHHSVQERFTFYRDATKVISDYPIIGAGGGAWTALYEKYQNNPYSSREAHSFFMQYITEVGWVGFALFALLFGSIIVYYIRTFIRSSATERVQSLPYFILASSILIHSTIDFNLSYVYIGCLLFIGLAGMAARIDWNRSWTNVSNRVNKVLQFTFPTIVAIMCIVLFVSATNHVRATGYFYDFRELSMQQGSTSVDAHLEPLNQAIRLDANHPVYVVEKARVLNSAYQQIGDPDLLSQLEELLEQHFQRDPYNRFLLEEYYNLHIVKDDWENALATMKLGIENFPWEISMYDRAIALHNNLAAVSVQDREQHLQRIISLSETVAEKQEHLKSLPEGQMQGRSFDLNQHSLDVIEYAETTLNLHK